MPDVRLIEVEQPVPVIVMFDWLMTPLGSLDQTNELITAVIVALGTDRIAGIDDELPTLPPDDDRRGWWADTDAKEIWNGWPIGSKLWLLMRGKITGPLSRVGDTVLNAERYVYEAMKPFLDQKIISGIDVAAERNSQNYSRIDVQLILYRGPNPPIAMRFDAMWDELKGE